MNTFQPTHRTGSGNPRTGTVRRLLLVGLASLSLAGCAHTQPQRATSNNKPGNNAPHEERNPSEHPELFRQ